MLNFYARNTGRPRSVIFNIAGPAPPEEQEREADEALDEALDETFPASDPIAPHLID